MGELVHDFQSKEKLGLEETTGRKNIRSVWKILKQKHSSKYDLLKLLCDCKGAVKVYFVLRYNEVSFYFIYICTLSFRFSFTLISRLISLLSEVLQLNLIAMF